MNQANNLRGLKLIEYKKILKLTEIQKDVLIGTLLGDATITKQKKDYNVKFEQKLDNSNYIHHLYDLFQSYVGTSPRIRNIKGGEAKDRQSIWFRTYRHCDFHFYYGLFYIKEVKNNLRKKRVPKLIHKFLTQRSLAYWFMDDGSYTFNVSKNTKKKNYYLNTQSFCYEDIKILKKALKYNFNIDTTIYKDRIYYLLAIQPQSNETFIQGIRPFILSLFDYKL
jgi:hypothetical protein